MRKSIVIALSATLLSVVPAHALLPNATLQAAAERAQDFDRFFFPDGAPSNYLDPKVSHGVEKIRELRTVIPGVLYRGGGPGGTNPLPSEALKNLCEAGFSLAVYGYTKNFKKPSPVTCTSMVNGQANTLEYIAVEANESDAKATVFARIKAIALDPSKGPALVHCWNGYHASGELAATGLRQFCGWDGDEASKYWLKHANGAPMISRVKKFSPIADAAIPDELRQEICRQKP